MRRLSTALPVAMVAAAALHGPSQAAAQSNEPPQSHVLVVVGLGGEASYRDAFHSWAVDLVTAAVERGGLDPARVVYLGERPGDAPGVVHDRSTLENLGAVLTRMARAAGPSDRVLVVLIGHGTGQGSDVRFNLPGPDLAPEELDRMLRVFPTQTVAVVNTSPSSGPFLQALSGPDRIILTATRTAQERNETQFGAFFVEAFKEDGADLDKDGRVSLLEAFEYARQGVLRYYGERNLLSTEHAQLDDDGDGAGSGEPGDSTSDGRLAGRFWLGSSSAVAAGAEPDSGSITDPELLRLRRERAEIEGQIQELRTLRGRMEERRYEEELERLLVELALKNRQIREKAGGGP